MNRLSAMMDTLAKVSHKTSKLFEPLRDTHTHRYNHTNYMVQTRCPICGHERLVDRRTVYSSCCSKECFLTLKMKP